MQGFQQQVQAWISDMAPLNNQQRLSRAYGSIMNDIWQFLVPALDWHAITMAEFEALGKMGWRRFIDMLPSRCVEKQMLLQYSKNPQSRTKHSDLNDWGALGVAVTYCDIVVTENHYSDLIGREKFKTNATVITDLRDLLPAMCSLPKGHLSSC